MNTEKGHIIKVYMKHKLSLNGKIATTEKMANNWNI